MRGGWGVGGRGVLGWKMRDTAGWVKVIGEVVVAKGGFKAHYERLEERFKVCCVEIPNLIASSC